jgi:hypothetical protein
LANAAAAWESKSDHPSRRQQQQQEEEEEERKIVRARSEVGRKG